MHVLVLSCARNDNLKVPAYFLEAKEGYIVRKPKNLNLKQKQKAKKQSHNTHMKAQGREV
jgi:hypothetical protein